MNDSHKHSGQRPLVAPAATPFVGRDAESEALGHLLLRQCNCLITLTGPGIIGNTRLAVEAARGLAVGAAGSLPERNGPPPDHVG